MTSLHPRLFSTSTVLSCPVFQQSRGVNTSQTDPSTTAAARNQAAMEDLPGGHHMSQLPCDAYAVIFALNDLDSFHHGGLSLRHLREDLGTDRAIILVGNKTDLVRQRRVSMKGWPCSLRVFWFVL